MATMKWKKAVMTMAASTRKRMNIVMMPTSKATTKMTMTMIAIKIEEKFKVMSKAFLFFDENGD